MLTFRSLLAAIVACVLLIAGCGGPTHKPQRSSAAKVALANCPQAASGHGSLGACAPKPQLGLTAPHLSPGPTYPDRSNNDPCYCGQQIKAAGQAGLIVKANQGTGFIDWTAAPMIASARAAGLAVGEYDFDQDYTVAEAQVFVARLHAAGIYPSTPNTFPAYLDVEYGNFNYGGLLAQIAYLHSQGYRVGIYTGQWYWTPHAGCRWPSGVSAWLSGYPVAPVPCGTTGYNAHQFTSTPIDLTVFLGSLTQFHAFVNATPPLPVCFTHRISASQCSSVKAKIAGYQRAVASSQRAYVARGCPVLAGRISWFSAHLKAQPRVRVAFRRGALATSQRVYRQRGCQVFTGRVGFYTNLIKQAKASH